MASLTMPMMVSVFRSSKRHISMSLRQSPAAKPMSPNLASSCDDTMLQSLADAAPMEAEAT